jgi:hypothetical protein
MGYRDKMDEGIKATGSFTFAQVHDAVKRVVDAMGEKAVNVRGTDETKGLIQLAVFKTGAQAVLHFNAIDALTKAPDMFACVEVKGAVSGKHAVSVSIEDANTSQYKVLGFIPASPKSIHGLTTYRDFVDHLAGELRKLDTQATVTINRQ